VRIALHCQLVDQQLHYCCHELMLACSMVVEPGAQVLHPSLALFQVKVVGFEVLECCLL
jgi:hypothetical protein